MKALLEIIVKSESEMKNIGGLISRLLKANDLITFEGDLGVGKTFLCKSIINSITNIKEVPSPTFNLVQTYPLNKVIEIWHCDFYRINNFEEVEEIGVFEDLKKKIILLEWPRFNLEIKNLDPLNITLSFIGRNEKQFSELRKISLFGSVNWFNRIKELSLNLDITK